ncbi:MAG TPA: carboxylesterase family protein, partial [Acidobacteriaceae bacterium]|nr:carboxylesterase family protein [Acidobacteriaceae bacterium]
MNSSSRRTFLQGSAAVAGLAFHPKLWAFASAEAPIATTTAGKISGYTEDGICVFKSVPYGADTAKTRFQPPMPPEKWSRMKECTRFTTMAPQLVANRGARSTSPTGNVPTSASGVPGGPSDAGVQSEDCLHLNVFTPALRDGRKRPVLCYFHGGAYNNGTVNNDLYDGRRLCHRGDVVVVTVNHRLNAFGYMYVGDLSPTYAKSGNAGQLDLVLALQWIKDNIGEFGGDPSRVLIFGQSGGGAKCATLMATPVAHGLF